MMKLSIQVSIQWRIILLLYVAIKNLVKVFLKTVPLKSKCSNILVVGADGLVGNALIKHLQDLETSVIATTRRPERVNKENLFLDLQSDLGDWKFPPHVAAAVVCAGATRIEACQNYPAESRKVNVNGTLALINRLVSEGIFVIYLSTNQVFDGSISHRMPDDVPCPITEYGRQKAETETLICSLKRDTSIIRFSKILSLKDPLFESWKVSMRKAEVIHPFSDMFLAPVPVDFVVRVIESVIMMRLTGILQVSGSYDLSYEQAAYLGAEQMHTDTAIIKAISAHQTGRFKESLPKHTTLNCDRIEKLGLIPPDVRETIQRCFSIS
jgi:dTDP-4-dehydrorhamnose reductase